MDYGWMDGRSTLGFLDGWQDELMDGWMNGLMDGFISDGRMDGWMEKWMDEWDGWMGLSQVLTGQSFWRMKSVLVKQAYIQNKYAVLFPKK